MRRTVGIAEPISKTQALGNSSAALLRSGARACRPLAKTNDLGAVYGVPLKGFGSLLAASGLCQQMRYAIA
jgi:hypothetical protein